MNQQGGARCLFKSLKFRVSKVSGKAIKARGRHLQKRLEVQTRGSSSSEMSAWNILIKLGSQISKCRSGTRSTSAQFKGKIHEGGLRILKNTNRKKVTTATSKSLARKLGCLRGACKCVADVEKVAGRHARRGLGAGPNQGRNCGGSPLRGWSKFLLKFIAWRPNRFWTSWMRDLRRCSWKRRTLLDKNTILKKKGISIRVSLNEVMGPPGVFLNPNGLDLHHRHAPQEQSQEKRGMPPQDRRSIRSKRSGGGPQQISCQVQRKRIRRGGRYREDQAQCHCRGEEHPATTASSTWGRKNTSEKRRSRTRRTTSWKGGTKMDRVHGVPGQVWWKKGGWKDSAKKVDLMKRHQQRNLALSPEEEQQLLEPKTIAGESCQKTSAAAGRSSAAAQLLLFLAAAKAVNSIELGRSGTMHGSTMIDRSIFSCEGRK